MHNAYQRYGREILQTLQGQRISCPSYSKAFRDPRGYCCISGDVRRKRHMGKTQGHVRGSHRERRPDLQTLLADICRRSGESYQQGVGRIAKSYIFAAPLKKGPYFADVAQLARARDL